MTDRDLRAERTDREDAPPAPPMPGPESGDSLWLRLGVPLTLLFMAIGLFLLVRFNASPSQADRPALVAMGLHALLALAASIGPNRMPKADQIGISLVLWLLCLGVIKAFGWIVASRCAGFDVPLLAACPDYGTQLLRGIHILFWVLVVCVLPLVFRAAWLSWDRSVLEDESDTTSPDSAPKDAP